MTQRLRELAALAGDPDSVPVPTSQFRGSNVLWPPWTGTHVVYITQSDMHRHINSFKNKQKKRERKQATILLHVNWQFFLKLSMDHTLFITFFTLLCIC